MPQDRSADATSAGSVADRADVIEWGADEPRRRPAVPLLAGLGGGGRTGPAIGAALGLATAFASLMTDWAHTVVRGNASSAFSPTEIDTGATDIGGLGSAYIVGVLAVVVLATLTFFGTPAARSNARIAGTATAGGLLALLIATTVSLEAGARRMYGSTPDLDVQVGYGRGLMLAYVGTAMVGVAVYLAGRARPGPEPPDGTRETDPPLRPAVGDAGQRGLATERPESDDDVRDLTVLPTTPFAHGDWEHRDRA